MRKIALMACVAAAMGAVAGEFFVATNGGGALYEFGREVTGSGTLEAVANGETVGTFTAADGMASARFKSELASNVLSFTYVPGENDVGGARLFAFSHEAGLTIILR